MSHIILKLGTVEVPKITKYQFDVNKLWSSNTGRNMDGDNKGTLIGNFTKLEIGVGGYSQEEYEMVMNQLKKATIQVTYYDPLRNAIVKESMYAGDVNAEVKSMKTDRMKAFSFNLIGNKKRSKTPASNITYL